MTSLVPSKQDERLMAACLRHARRNRSLTATNPSVGTMLVKNGVAVGRGVTARGGRPHAERLAINEAGERANGSTAYVSLEPCAHHGATPPCAAALIEAGVAHVFTAWTDPDNRVNGLGHSMLKKAGVGVTTGVCAKQAARDLRPYLIRKLKNRPQVILKLAVSSDGMLGLPGKETTITGALSRAYVHRMRAEADAILVGRGTVETDDPDLTCRLPGLTSRSPKRFVLDTGAGMQTKSRLAQTARSVPTYVVCARSELPRPLEALGVQHFASELHEGTLALPEVLEDMAAMGISSVLVEGGAAVARSFLDIGMVDDIALFTGATTVGKQGIRSPVSLDNLPQGFGLVRQLSFGDDSLHVFEKET